MFLQPTRTSPCLPIATLSSSRTFLMNAQKKKFKKFSSIFQFFYGLFCFRVYGPITSVRVPRWPQTGRTKGIAYITYKREDSVLQAVKKSGTITVRRFSAFLMRCRWITDPFLSISRPANPRPASEIRMESIGTNPMRKRRRIPNDLHWRPKPTRRFTYKASLRIVLCFVVSDFLFLMMIIVYYTFCCYGCLFKYSQSFLCCFTNPIHEKLLLLWREKQPNQEERNESSKNHDSFIFPCVFCDRITNIRWLDFFLSFFLFSCFFIFSFLISDFYLSTHPVQWLKLDTKALMNFKLPNKRLQRSFLKLVKVCHCLILLTIPTSLFMHVLMLSSVVRQKLTEQSHIEAKKQIESYRKKLDNEFKAKEQAVCLDQTCADITPF